MVASIVAQDVVEFGYFFLGMFIYCIMDGTASGELRAREATATCGCRTTTKEVIVIHQHHAE